MLYSIEDYNNPIFSIYEYEKSIPKGALFTNYLIRRIILDSKMTTRDVNFIKEGKGNIVFAQASYDEYETFENFQIIIALYDLILLYRKMSFVSSLNFIFACPGESVFEDEPELNEYVMKELKDRNINVVFGSDLV